MQAPRVPSWDDADLEEIAIDRAGADQDDMGDLTPVVLAVGVVLVIAVILMAFVGVDAIGGDDSANGPEFPRVDWDGEPERVSTGLPRAESTQAAVPSLDVVGDDGNPVPVDLAANDGALAAEPAEAAAPTTTSAVERTDVPDSTDTVGKSTDTPETNDNPQARDDLASGDSPVAEASLEIISDPSSGASEAVALSTNSTTIVSSAPPTSTVGAVEAAPTSPTTASPGAVTGDSVRSQSPPTTQLVATGFDLGGLALDVGETTAIVRWNASGPTAEITGYDVSWSCCGEASLTERVGPDVRRLQMSDLAPLTRHIVVVAAVGPDGEIIERTSRTRTITTKRSGLGGPPAASDVTAVAGPGPNQITLEWQVDTDESLGGFFVSIGCCGGPLEDKSQSIDDPNARVHVINGLARGVTYTIDLLSKDVNFIADKQTTQRVYLSLDAE